MLVYCQIDRGIHLMGIIDMVYSEPPRLFVVGSNFYWYQPPERIMITHFGPFLVWLS